MRELLIPYAHSGAEKAPIFPEQAFSGGDYTCPECDGRVGLRIPQEKRTHFYHLPPYQTCALNPELGGGGEGQLHAQAKHMLFAWLHRWLSGQIAVAPRMVGKCSTHKRQFEVSIPKPTPFQLFEEYVLPAGRRLDVALLNSDGRVTMGFEIRSKNPVIADKAADLPARWLELRASSVVKAYMAVLDGVSPPPIDLLRWAEYDRPDCCKQGATAGGRFGGTARFASTYVGPRSIGNSAPGSWSPSNPVPVPEPVAQDASDADLLSAAGKACANGQTPRSFAASYAAQNDMRESRVLSRLMAYGIAKSGWSWT